MLRLIADVITDETASRVRSTPENLEQNCNVLKDRFNGLRRMAIELQADDFAEAYNELHMQVAEIESEIQFAPNWVRNREIKKLSVLSDKMRILSGALDNAAIQTQYLINRVRESGHNLSFRRAA